MARNLRLDDPFNGAGYGDLSQDLVQVWRIPLARLSIRGDLESLLSIDETERARSFFFERDCRQFMLVRAGLRIILGYHLKKDPESVVFSYGPQGKPFLAAETSTIRFNVAHSGDLALIAVSHGREVGVDLEGVRPLDSLEQIVEGCFSSRETEVFRSLPPHEAGPAFFACWTRKEAYIKARGGGLSIPLDRFAVSLEPGKPATLLEVLEDPLEISRWGMVELRPAPGYAGALVAQGKDWHFRYCDWPAEAQTDH